MSGLLLRLAGPQSSWGESAAFHDRLTTPFPTRSALIGLFAAAEGRPRHTALHPHRDLPGAPCYTDLVLTIRIDRPGTPHTDFHTTGGGRPPGRGLRTSDGRHRPPAKSTLVTHRRYLAGAVFTVAVQGPPVLLQRIADTLEQPRWAPFLGRRSCVPDEPLVLRASVPDPVGELTGHVPLTLDRPPPPGQDTVAVGFLWEHPPPHTPAATEHHLADTPADFTPATRRYRMRPVWHTTEHLPAALYAGPRPLDRLTDYVLNQEHPA
ncbi:type I-E CRISPR-associated protein Cas5/CasD [Actinacidiphila oryziradicis]|uniref:Type I-E CRISPR-associated protein Cas5/CasD n=1 Tax=Actinacidiphila oryziradicis TaxID=2571141 RepID=A0A4U0SH75_9ACTN|nr:type I-E CRISPR-associated protein Cas5/CasD [Actinacidiphila oryziradicis]TJZ99594.1 type I-E CRISPR-associated protein Cas5/CasD [Actinacidiphila oryziradicis]